MSRSLYQREQFRHKMRQAGDLAHARAVAEAQAKAKAKASLDPLFVMPYGEHKGKPLCEIPVSYLEFFARVTGLNPQLIETVKAYLTTRQDVV